MRHARIHICIHVPLRQAEISLTDCGVEDEPQNFSDEAKMMRGFVERFSDSWDRLFTDDMCMAPAEDPIHNKEQEVTIRHPNPMNKKVLGPIDRRFIVYCPHHTVRAEWTCCG